MRLITCRNISAGYEDGDVIKGLSFEVQPGDYLCVVGENGSGKTTLMKALLGLIRVSKGEIVYGDGLNRREIGYLPQQSNIQKDFPATVREVVLSGCLNKLGRRFFYGQKEKAIAEENMKRMNIIHLADHSYRELSGGQQQRVLLARALCATSKLLVLDEPVTGLDSATAEEMYQLIDRLNKEGITIIMISHDLTEVYHHAGKILAFDRNVFFGTVEDYVQGKRVMSHD